jgi:hypothetical protein
MTSAKVRFMRGGDVLAEKARMVAFAIHTPSARRRASWGGAITLRGVPPLDAHDDLAVEFCDRDGGAGRFPIIVRRLVDGVLAEFRGAGPPPPGLR